MSMAFGVVAILAPVISIFFILTNNLVYFNIFILRAVGAFSALCAFFIALKKGVVYRLNLWTWLQTLGFQVDFTFKFSAFSCAMLFVVSMVGSCVFVYSLSYMGSDPNFPRFLLYVALFEFLMYFLVFGDNLAVMFFGWEGIGLCSYLLIGFWSTRLAAAKAAIKAMVMNAIGDVCFLTGMAICLWTFGTLKVDVLTALLPLFAKSTIDITWTDNWNLVTVLATLFLICVISKSAQLGLHIWLSDAMEGPTPVSALIHAATMVTAGIYLVLRMSVLYELSRTALLWMVIIGSVTALASACIALAQNDMKKVIAFSTCSQLGYLMLSCGLSAYSAAFFHLCTHAFFKALLFLTAGAIIHSIQGEQDIRRMGGLAYSLPIACVALSLGGAALSGLPMLAGFFSKDFIIELALVTHTNNGMIAATAAICTAFITAIYSAKLSGAVFFDVPNLPRGLLRKVHEMDQITFAAVVPLIVLTIFSGYLFRDMFVGFGAFNFNETLFVNVKSTSSVAAAELLSKRWKLFVFLGVHYAWLKSLNTQFEFTYDRWYDGLTNKLFFDFIYMYQIAQDIMIEIDETATEIMQASVSFYEDHIIDAVDAVVWKYKSKTGGVLSFSLILSSLILMTVLHVR